MKYALWLYPVHLLAYGLGSGLVPFAPGTMASLLGLAVFKVLSRLRSATYAAVLLVMTLAGVFICGQAARDIGASDPGIIVYDEITGLLVAFFRLPSGWAWVFAGFVIYRALDILKPWPVNAAEHLGSPGISIMADDLVAGFITLCAVQLVQWFLHQRRARQAGE